MMTLKGHMKPVLCLSQSMYDMNILCSSSEDSTARFWDLRTNKPFKALVCPSNSINSIQFKNDCEVIIACGNELLSFDIRKNYQQLLEKEYTMLKGFSEELNQVVVSNEKLLVCDDDGNVHDLNQNKSILGHPQSICTSIGMISDQYYISGGLDDKLVIYDEKKGITFRKSINKLQIFNPPHVHAIDVLKQENEQSSSFPFCFALGDGSICYVPSIKLTRKVNWNHLFDKLMIRHSEVHMASTCCIQFLNENLVGSAGTDQTLAITKFENQESQVIKRFALKAKPNSIVFPKLFPSLVFIGDIEGPIKVYKIE